MRLPESLLPLLPADVDPSAVSDCVVLRTEAAETLLLRLPTGPRALSRSKPTAKFEGAADARPLRVEDGSLRISTGSSERAIGLTSWLDRELVRDFLALLSVPMGATRAPLPSPPRIAPASTPSPPATPAPPPPAPPTPLATPSASSGPMRLTLKLAGGRSQNPILAIKAVREMTGLGLKEAKDLVELGGSSAVVGSPSLARQIDDLNRAGCTYEVTPG